MEEFTEENKETLRPRSHRKPEKIHNINFIVRQILNVLFMVIAVIGCLMYVGVIGGEESEMQGAIVVIIAVMIKMAECMLRLLKKKGEDEE